MTSSDNRSLATGNSDQTTPAPQYSSRNTGVLAPQAVTSLSETLNADASARIAINAVTTTDVDKVALNRQRVMSLDHSVSHKTDTWAVANQKKSGRCWIFSGLNSMRGNVMSETGIKDFELSQNYVSFYDKLEKANYFLTAMRELADRPIEDRAIQHLLQAPIDDGGQWNMFVALINKYGVVPQYAMPETQSSSHTRHMNRDLASVLRAGATHIRKAVAEDKENNADSGAVKAIHDDTMTSIYRILTIHLGVPPEKFVWQYRTKDNDFVRKGTMTPQEFAATYLPSDLDDYVCVVSDPRSTSPYGDTFTVEYLGNVVGAKPVTYLNAPIEVLKKAALGALVDGNPVWFGCDTLAQSNAEQGYWSLDLYNYDTLYGVDLSMPKEDRLLSGDSMMTHAMVFTGVDLIEDADDFDPATVTSSDNLPETARPRKWRVENSWGPDKADKGFWTMDDSWFSENVYEIAVPKARLPKEYQDALSKEPHVLPAWDPMGALARG